MRNAFLLLLVTLLFSTPVYPAQYTLLTEIFSAVVCQYCPYVREAIEDMYDDPDVEYNIIPIDFVEQTDVRDRRKNGTYAHITNTRPISIFGGDDYQTGSTGVGTYPTRYNTLISFDSPFTLSPTLTFSSQGQVKIDVDIQVDENLLAGIDTDHLYVHFFLMKETGPGSTVEGTSAIRFMALGYESQLLEIEPNVTEYNFSQDIPFGMDWVIPELRAIVIVQDMVPAEGLADPNRTVYQAAMTSYTGTGAAACAADLLSGPPNLHVNFSDRSFFSGDEIVAWEWDFDNDGTVDSEAQNPAWDFTAPGPYSVKLSVTSRSGITATSTFTDMINVTSPSNVSGIVAGEWVADNSPYVLTGNIQIPNGFALTIESGVTIQIQSDVAIAVNGDFQVLGTQDNPIVFTSEDTWSGMKLFTGPPSVIRHATFEKAVATPLSTNRDTQIEYCTFKNNHGYAGAGAIEFSYGQSTVTGSFFANNQANNTNGCAGIFVKEAGTVVTISNSLIVNNTSANIGAIRVTSRATLNIENCTIYNNQTTSAGGNILNTNSGTINIINSIIDGPARLMGSPVAINISHSLTTISGNGVTLGEGIITGDPAFSNPTSAVGYLQPTVPRDWVLTEDSPCIDAGDPDTLYNDKEDPENEGFALWPAFGTLRNDLGAFGGPGDAPLVEEQEPPISEYIDSISPKPALKVSTYPNPFNPIMYVNVSTPDTHKHLNVAVYNIRGQKVIELYNDKPTSTNITLTWNGKDTHGTSVGNGVYFVRVSDDQSLNVKKVLLLK